MRKHKTFYHIIQIKKISTSNELYSTNDYGGTALEVYIFALNHVSVLLVFTLYVSYSGVPVRQSAVP